MIRPPKQTVCVVGAGIAGLEGLLGMRALSAYVKLQLIAPAGDFRYRPMNADSLFRPAEERSLAIGDLVARTGATWVADRADVIRPSDRQVLTRDGDLVDYDYLLLAVGSRSARTLQQGYVWERGGDPESLDQLISELRAGKVQSVAVTVPRTARWPLPAYELALVLAWSTSDTGARITLLTGEATPLEALGSEATHAVTKELESAGVELIAGVDVSDAPGADHVSQDRIELVLSPAGDMDDLAAPGVISAETVRGSSGARSAVQFERLISLPAVLGPRITGISRDAAGFIEVDETLRVYGSERIWAAGSCLSAGLEHSALAARQADAAIAGIAETIDRADGARLSTSSSVSPELAGILLTGQRDRWLAENPVGTHAPSTRCLWWPPGRAVGTMLAGQIAAWNPSIHEALPGHPEGLIIHAPVALGCPMAVAPASHAASSAKTRAARRRDIENRQERAIQRRERDAENQLRALSSRLETFTAHERSVVHELQQHGYLVHHARSQPTRRSRRQ